MNKHKSIIIVFCLFLAGIYIQGATQAQTTSLSVVVSIAPLAGIVQEVGGELIDTSVIMPEGIEPHTFTLTPEDVLLAESADLLVLTGHFTWEADLLEQVNTRFITFDNPESIANYKDQGARYSPMPGHHVEDSEYGHEDGNPHAWWMLPSNALAIANTTKIALSLLNSTAAATWNANFEEFVRDIETFNDLISTIDDAYGFSNMHAVTVFPAEAYVAEAFGITVTAVLQVDQVFIDAAALLEVEGGLRNGSIQLILGSDVARLQTGGQFALQLSQDSGTPLIWWQTLFSDGLSDYLAIMTINLGALTTGLDEDVGPATSEAINIVLLAIVGVLGVIVVIETLLIVLRARVE